MTDLIPKAFTGKLEPEDVNYVPLSPYIGKGKACSSCRWFMNDGCFIVDSSDREDQPIIATGYCDRWEASPPEPPNPMDDVVEALTEALQENAQTIGGAIMNAAPTMDMGKSTRKPLLARLRSILTPKAPDEAFSVFKGVDGHWHWHAVFTNNFEDREGEILTEKAHDKYIARLDMGLVPMPVLQAWHTPGTEHGEADMLWRSGHFVHAVGHFDDTPQAEKAIAFYRKNTGKIKMSHGFTVPEWAFDGKHYDDYNTIEITTLPPYAAANPYTSFEELKAMQKEMSEEKRRYIEQIVGKDKFAEIAAADEQRSKALEDMKVAYKDYADATPETTPEHSDHEKALSAVYSDLVVNQDELLNLVVAQSKAIKAGDDRYAKLEAKFDADTELWQKELDSLRAVVNAPPRRASQDNSTRVSETEKQTLKNVIPADDKEASFWGVPLKPKP